MSETQDYSVLDEIEQLSQQFQDHSPHGGVRVDGLVGHHTLFAHDQGLDHAWDTALHAALDEVLMEVSLDPHIVEENHGEATPATLADELESQLRSFTTIRSDLFIDALTDTFEEKLRGYEEDLEERDADE